MSSIAASASAAINPAVAASRPEVCPAQPVVLAIQFERHAVLLEPREDACSHRVIERRHTDRVKSLVPRFGNFQESHILEMHIAVRDQPGEQSALENDQEILFRRG